MPRRPSGVVEDGRSDGVDPNYGLTFGLGISAKAGRLEFMFDIAGRARGVAVVIGWMGSLRWRSSSVAGSTARIAFPGPP